MIYGDRIVYRFEEEVPKTNEKGETLISDSGEILTDKKQKTLNLGFTALTPIYYKNATGKELLVDFSLVAAEGKKLEENDKKLKAIDLQTNIDELSKENIEKIAENTSLSSLEFFINVAAAMIKTAENGRRSYEQIIAEDLSSGVILDGTFIQEITQLLCFGVKKNYRL